VISVVIPFLDEREEVERTCASVRRTAGRDVEIVLIDDHSETDFDYEAAAGRVGARLCRNAERYGVARCRDAGVADASGENILLLDAHMRMMTDGWAEAVERILENLPSTVNGMTCVVLGKDGNPTGAEGQGGHIAFDMYGGLENFIEPKWSPPRGLGLREIPCVVGGAYFFRKDFYLRLGGLRGLRTYGSDEQFLSIKAWLAGGTCQVAGHLRAGHIFRSVLERPYEVPWEDLLFNKLLIINTLFPDEDRPAWTEAISQFPGWMEAMGLLRRYHDVIESVRASVLRVRTFKDFLKVNAREINAKAKGLDSSCVVIRASVLAGMERVVKAAKAEAERHGGNCACGLCSAVKELGSKA
jgi:glycosyltransferase involved in cell wall biosynthesis